MQHIDDELAKGAIGEEILAQIKLVLEVVGAQPTRTEFNELSAKVDRLGDDVQTIKVVLSDVSAELRGRDTRLVDLESDINDQDDRRRSLRRKAA